MAFCLKEWNKTMFIQDQGYKMAQWPGVTFSISVSLIKLVSYNPGLRYLMSNISASYNGMCYKAIWCLCVSVLCCSTSRQVKETSLSGKFVILPFNQFTCHTRTIVALKIFYIQCLWVSRLISLLKHFMGL